VAAALGVGAANTIDEMLPSNRTIDEVFMDYISINHPYTQARGINTGLALLLDTLVTKGRVTKG